MQVKHGHEMKDMNFCHHCKQTKRDVVYVKCKFHNRQHRVIHPASVEVNGVKIYNADPYCKDKLRCLLLKKLIKDKKRRKTYEDQLQIGCNQQFCSLCLKNFYDTNIEDVRDNPDWICPYCLGHCFCTRCRRQDQLTYVKGYLVSLNLKDLVFSPRNASKIFG